MSLKYAILGYLSSAPGSGYDLMLQLDGGLGWFWSASHSQIYPELRRLEADGFIEGLPTTVGERLEKRVYALTPAGRDLLRRWADEPPEYRPNRDAERLQLIFADNSDSEAIRRHLRAHIDHFTSRRDRLSEMRNRILGRHHERVEKRLSALAPRDRARSLLLRDLAYSGDIRRAELEILWATEALLRVDALENSDATFGPDIVAVTGDQASGATVENDR